MASRQDHSLKTGGSSPSSATMATKKKAVKKTAKKPNKKAVKKTATKHYTRSKKVGRPLAITPEKEELIIQMLSDGMSQKKAARYVGVNEKTLIEHKRRFPEFLERLDKAMLETHKLAHKSVKVGMMKDWKAGAWWLERTEPERFREKKEIDIKEQPILIDDIMGDTNGDETE